MKLETILVPTDFSEDAKEATRTAVDFARAFGAQIVLVHAYHVDIPMASPLLGAYPVPDGFYEGVASHARAMVDAAVEELSAEGIDA